MPSVLYSQQENVAVLTLNRPEKANAFNREMALQLQEALDTCAADEGIRCIVLTGAGTAFCAGQDLAEAIGGGSFSVQQILEDQYNPVVRRIRQIPKPVIAAVNGVAAGAGANIALCADIIVASEAASFIQAFGKIGLIPDSGGTWFLPRLVGWQKASALMLLGEKLPATEAEKIGLIYKVLPAETFLEATMQMATMLAGMPTKALALTKEALNRSAENSLEQQLQTEIELQTTSAQTADFKEGVTAFLQKRKPQFTGK